MMFLPDKQDMSEERLPAPCHALIPAYEYSCGGGMMFGAATDILCPSGACLELHYPLW